MDWKKHFEANKVTAEEAAKKIKSGDGIVLTHASGEPGLLMKALKDRQNEIEGVTIFHGLSYGPGHHVAEDLNPESVRHESMFVGSATRKSAADHRTYMKPMHFSDSYYNIKNGLIKCDVAAMHVSPPDRFGYCSFGVSCDYERIAVDTAKTVIAEVNPNMPYVFGKSFVHVSEIDYFIESNEPILTVAESVIGEKEEAIGKLIADEIPDGSTLQIGVGAMPDAVMNFLSHREDLGIHTEMITTGSKMLIESGAVTNKYKNINTGVSVASFAGGTPELYEWLNENPMVEFWPIHYTNDARTISKIDNMMSVNSALEVDLMGQVCAEAIGIKQYSGIGGQMDFVRGATWAKGGKSFIALTSTAKGGTVSRISAALAPGTTVSTSRNDVDNIVTEYGIAALRGQTLPERAKRLIAVAHPDFRDQLREDFEKVYGFKLK